MKPRRPWTGLAASMVAGVLLFACGSDDACLEPEPGMICGLAGTGFSGYNGDGLEPLETHFSLLSAARRGPGGRLHLMDFNNMRLRVVGDDGLITTLAGNGYHAYAFPGVPATESPLENPIDFDFLPDGRVVFVAIHDPRVMVVDADDTLHMLAGSGNFGMEGNEGDGGPALAADFIQLEGIAVGPDGALYVSDSIADRVRKIEGGIVTTFAGTGEGGYTGDGGPAKAAALHGPTALTFDDDGDLFVADSENHVIRKIAADGTISTVAGTGVLGFSGDGGPATEAQLYKPMGVAVAADGTLYIADSLNSRVRRVSPDGVIETVAGTGQRGHSGDGGPALEAELGVLVRVALDGDQLLIADQSNGSARVLHLEP